VGQAGELESLRLQEEAIGDYLASGEIKGWVRVCETYQDIGFSANNQDRPAFKRLLTDVASGKIDCVVAQTPDRLTRRVEDWMAMAIRFQMAGVLLVIVSPRRYFGPLPSGKERKFAIWKPTKNRGRSRRFRGAWTG
jgi:site-specific DNA recombinase